MTSRAINTQSSKRHLVKFYRFQYIWIHSFNSEQIDLLYALQKLLTAFLVRCAAHLILQQTHQQTHAYQH